MKRVNASDFRPMFISPITKEHLEKAHMQIGELASAIGLKYATLGCKMTGFNPWKDDEVRLAKKALAEKGVVV